MPIENKTNGPIVNRNIAASDISAQERVKFGRPRFESVGSPNRYGDTANILASLETTNCDQLLAKLDRYWKIVDCTMYNTRLDWLGQNRTNNKDQRPMAKKRFVTNTSEMTRATGSADIH
ncbi:hypothetical protein CBL_00566 [Carabus blaptoides fortunei]